MPKGERSVVYKSFVFNEERDSFNCRKSCIQRSWPTSARVVVFGHLRPPGWLSGISDRDAILSNLEQ
jgi:hypothetical protein